MACRVAIKGRIAIMVRLMGILVGEVPSAASALPNQHDVLRHDAARHVATNALPAGFHPMNAEPHMAAHLRCFFSGPFISILA